MRLRISPPAKKAILIGSLCSISYLAVYVAKNILSAVSPQMIESGTFSQKYIGTLSSIYFVTYAFGQLINGRIGDKIKGKYMISLGLGFSGICYILFRFFSHSLFTAYTTYGLTGFFLSMIFGPMSKIVSENTDPFYTTRCTLGYTFASFLGSPMAGILASFFIWKDVFTIGSYILLFMGLFSYIIFSLFEKKGYIEYGKYQCSAKNGFDIKILLQHHIVKFTLIAIITGVVRTTIVFWLPTYLSQHLSFPAETSAMIFTVATFIISATSFVAVFLYERLGRNIDLTILISFVSASVCFLVVYLCKQATANIVFMILGIMSSNCASAMIWSRYCPSLRDTGMVSSVTGYLDFTSYIAAAMASTLFANAVSQIGWSNLILVWLGLMVAGVLVSLPKKQKVSISI